MTKVVLIVSFIGLLIGVMNINGLRNSMLTGTVMWETQPESIVSHWEKLSPNAKKHFQNSTGRNSLQAINPRVGVVALAGREIHVERSNGESF